MYTRDACEMAYGVIGILGMAIMCTWLLGPMLITQSNYFIEWLTKPTLYIVDCRMQSSGKMLCDVVWR